MKLPEPVIPGWYSTSQIQGIFDNCTRQYIHLIASRENWPHQQLLGRGTTFLYRVEDIVRYKLIKQRIELAKKLGFTAKLTGRPGEFPRTDAYDIQCPRCKAFAVEIPEKGRICENGHRKIR